MSCETCNDEREVHVDRADVRAEHVTEARPCPTCCGPADSRYARRIAQLPDEPADIFDAAREVR